jgi:hypothetical protein
MMYVWANEKAVSLNLHRYSVGEMSLVTAAKPGSRPKVRLSTMDFWGFRVDTAGLYTLHTVDP